MLRGLWIALAICLAAVVFYIWGLGSFQQVGNQQVLAAPPGCTLKGAKYSPGWRMTSGSGTIVCTHGDWVRVGRRGR